jgi:hypothetical protein
MSHYKLGTDRSELWSWSLDPLPLANASAAICTFISMRALILELEDYGKGGVSRIGLYNRYPNS